MPASISIPLAVFEEHMLQIKQTFRYIQAAGAVKRCAADVVDKVHGKAYALAEMKKFLEIGDYPEQQHCNSYFVSLVAGFEEFLRKTLETAVKVRARTAKDFDELGTSVHDLHMKATGFLLTLKSNPPQQLRSLDFFQVCRNIGTCFPGTTSFTLNPEAISIQSSLLDLESFMDVLNKFQYKISWDILGADVEVKKCMGVKGTRDSAKSLKQSLTKMVRQRNRVAHTGSSSDITPGVLEEYLASLVALARAITGCLQK